jgi:hypothetical protein
VGERLDLIFRALNNAFSALYVIDLPPFFPQELIRTVAEIARSSVGIDNNLKGGKFFINYSSI